MSSAKPPDQRASAPPAGSPARPPGPAANGGSQPAGGPFVTMPLELAEQVLRALDVLLTYRYGPKWGIDPCYNDSPDVRVWTRLALALGR